MSLKATPRVDHSDPITLISELDLLIRDGLILSLSPAFPEIFSGSVGIQGKKIVLIQPQGSERIIPPAQKVIEARNKLVMPGLINCHTHGAMTLFRGLADDLPLKVWLEQTIFPAEGRFVNPESVYWGTLLACAEMMLSGTTTFADGYFFMDQAVKAVDRSGLRALLCQGVLDFPIPGVPDPAQNSALAGRFVDTWAGFSSRIQTGIFCHSPYTCSSETLRKVKSLCRQKGVPFFIHVAETREEVSQIQSREGRTPIEYLQALDLLDRQTVAVHAIHLNSREIETLAQTGTAVVHCPESNMKLASGVAPIAQMLKQGIRVGLGTDSSASNNDLDLFKEMDTAAKLEKVHSMDPSLLNARTVLALATSQGADILGLGIQVGSIEIGKDADIVLLDLLTPHLVPCHNPFSLLVYAAQGSDVHSVMIAGRMVVENRQILTFDLSEVLGQVTRISQWISKG